MANSNSKNEIIITLGDMMTKEELNEMIVESMCLILENAEELGCTTSRIAEPLLVMRELLQNAKEVE